MRNIYHARQGQMEEGLIYFYTQSVYKMKPLLEDDNLKMEVINSLRYLAKNKLVKVFGYVVMINHIHLLWQMLKIGKESPAASFAKHTGHQFKKYLDGKESLNIYRSEKADRSYQFWKRDPLAIPMSLDEIFFQRLEYIHYNPVKAGICVVPEEYKWSSARFYLEGVDEFGILSRYPE